MFGFTFRVGYGYWSIYFRYKIDGKLVFIRMLKNKHVMVRVGGGWDTLANYLLKHDCQKMVKIPTPTR